MDTFWAIKWKDGFLALGEPPHYKFYITHSSRNILVFEIEDGGNGFLYSNDKAEVKAIKGLKAGQFKISAVSDKVMSGVNIGNTFWAIKWNDGFLGLVDLNLIEIEAKRTESPRYELFITQYVRNIMVFETEDAGNDFLSSRRLTADKAEVKAIKGLKAGQFKISAVR